MRPQSRYTSTKHFGTSTTIYKPDLISLNLIDPVTETTGDRINPGLQTVFGFASIPGSKYAIAVQLNSGTTVWRVPPFGGPTAPGLKWKALNTTSNSYAAYNGTESPPCIEFPDGVGQGSKMWSGTGLPSASSVGNANPGDWYWRIRSGGSTQILYVCTVAGAPGTWVQVI